MKSYLGDASSGPVAGETCREVVNISEALERGR